MTPEALPKNQAEEIEEKLAQIGVTLPDTSEGPLPVSRIDQILAEFSDGVVLQYRGLLVPGARKILMELCPEIYEKDGNVTLLVMAMILTATSTASPKTRMLVKIMEDSISDSFSADHGT
jgi:hypothetical protein